MTKQHKKIDKNKAMTAAKKSLDFWTAIDGSKLATLGYREKEMDIIGPTKKVKFVNYG